MKSPRAAFTLIELLVVIAIIAVLSVVVVLSLNPAELLRQSRDANRLSDLSTLNSALALYTTDQAGVPGFSLGNASSVYVSLPDSSSTCGTWSLPALPSGYTYACSTSTSSKNIASTGWIPVNFSNISGGAPFSNLPIDGINQSSTGLYYIYYSNGSQFVVTAIPESQKQKTALAVNTPITSYPDVMANGSNMTISPLFSTSGLVGWWPLNEGANTVAYDQSGTGGNGAWGGTQVGTNGYYSGGKVGPWAGTFNGSNDYINLATTTATFSISSNITLSAWMYISSWVNWSGVIEKSSATEAAYGMSLTPSGKKLRFNYNNVSPWANVVDSNTTPPTGTWIMGTMTYDGATVKLYLNGALDKSAALAITFDACPTCTLSIGQDPPGGTEFFNGLIDDVRIYNRVLSPAEIAALYNAEK